MKTKYMIVCMALLVAIPTRAKESATVQTADANESVVTSLFGIRRVKGSDKTCTMTLEHVEDFDHINLKVSADVEYRQSTDGKIEVTVTVAENLADLVEVTSRNGRLTVSYKNKYRGLSISNSRLKIVASSPSLSAVTIGGSGDVTLKGNIRGESLSFTINGSGDIDCHAVEELKTCVNGSGEITCSGRPKVSGGRVEHE